MHRVRTALVLVALLTLGAATVAFAGGGGGDDGHRDAHGDRGDRHDDHGDRHGEHRRHGRFAVAKLMNADGDRIGRVWFRQRGRDDAVFVFARVRDLPPGFHGFHVHTVGLCQPPGFTSGGGHLNPTEAPHGEHAGDLPVLLVNEDGTGVLATVTDRFALDDLRDADGSAVIVHEQADNYANIPARYGGPDADTLLSGDSGGRIACGEVR